MINNNNPRYTRTQAYEKHRFNENVNKSKKINGVLCRRGGIKL